MNVIEALSALGVQAVVVGDEPITEGNYTSRVVADSLPPWNSVVAKMNDRLRADIKAEANRRIEAEYPLWKQMNIMRIGSGNLSAMTSFIDGIRTKSDALETTLPENFKDDVHWA